MRDRYRDAQLFDEPPALLREAVKGAATICDRIVAADGAYSLVPDARATSPRSQREAIKDEAQKQGLKVEFLRPKVYLGQVAKRDHTLQRAKIGSNWVVVVDADWRISGDRDSIRAELGELYAENFEQVLVNFVTPDDPSRTWEEKAANQWHFEQMGQWFQYAFIYRVFPVMHYQKNHWSLLAETADGTKVGLFGLDNAYATRRPLTSVLRSTHLFEHRCLHRETKQIMRARAYIAARDPEAERVGYET